MSNNIKPEELQKAIMEYLEDYVEDIEEDVEDTTNTVVKEAKQELVQKSPKSGIARKTKYYKGWAIKNGGRTRKRKYYIRRIRLCDFGVTKEERSFRYVKRYSWQF